MDNIKPVLPIEEKVVVRKSEQYKSFPDASFGLWGKDVRENHPDQLHTAIIGRIKHIFGRIDTYLSSPYKLDQTLIVDIENSFDELAQLYLKYAQEGHGGVLYPVDDKGQYSFEIIKAFDLKLEEIHNSIIDAERPLFEENRFVHTEDQNNALHVQGVGFLENALNKIKMLKNSLVESKLP